MSGWIKMHRKVREHWIYSKPEYFYWWFDILSEVNFEDKKVLIGESLFLCKRGQSLNSTITWSKRWKVSKSKAYRFLKMLESDHMIVLKSETQTTRLTVCKYETYQENGNTDETQVKRKRNATETQVKTTKEVKKKRSKEEAPLFKEFLSYALDKKPTVDPIDLKLKYEAWKVAGWKKSDKKGGYVDILNWKSTLLQTIPFIKDRPKKGNLDMWGNPKLPI